MARFAVIKNNVIINVAEADSAEILELLIPEADSIIEETLETGLAWVGSPIIDGKFQPIQNYPSWTWNAEAFIWEAPSAYPSDGKMYIWDETDLAWVEFTIGSAE